MSTGDKSAKPDEKKVQKKETDAKSNVAQDGRKLSYEEQMEIWRLRRFMRLPMEIRFMDL